MSDHEHTDPARPDRSDDTTTGPVARVSPDSPGSDWQARPSGALSHPTPWAGSAAGSDRPAGSGPAGSDPGPASGYGPAGDRYGQPEAPSAWSSTGSAPSNSSWTGQNPTGYLPYGSGGYPASGSQTPVSAPPTPAPRRRRGGLTAALVAGTVVLAVGGGIGGGLLGSRLNDTAASTPTNSLTTTATTAQAAASLLPAGVNTVSDVAKKLLPSVVSIVSLSSSDAGEGSGIILSPDGLILTNNHVVAGATSLTVRFNDGSSAQADLKGADATDDLAVIKAKGVSGLTTATLGSSANLTVGQPVVAVGSPLGLSATVTSGIVSAMNRPVRTAEAGQSQNPTQTGDSTVLNAIQTDAAINPGNSGGPLVDMSGQVIGINSAIASLSAGSSSAQSGSIGVGFAIPIDQARRIAQEIVNTGKASHAVLGASVSDDTPAGGPQVSGSPLSNGAKIARTVAGSGAEKAGLQAGDVITKVGGQPVDSADALIAFIRAQKPGGTVDLTYQRGSTSKTVTVTLGSATSK